jgi:hypothetical protein
MNVFIEDVIAITNDIKKLNKKVDELTDKINLIYSYFEKKQKQNKQKKQKKLLNNFTYSSTDESDYSTNSESECSCNKEPQKEDKEISDYLKRIMKKNETNHTCSCGCGREFF